MTLSTDAGEKVMRWLPVVGAVVLLALPGPALADEKADIEAACVTLGLGEKSCPCIAEDTVTRFAEDARAREVIFLSLKDDVAFEVMVKSGAVTQDEFSALDAYQRLIEPICRVD